MNGAQQPEKKFTQNDMDISLLQREVTGIREQAKEHAKINAENFQIVMKEIKDLTGSLNRGKGMFAGAMMAAGALGALVTKGMALLFR